MAENILMKREREKTQEAKEPTEKFGTRWHFQVWVSEKKYNRDHKNSREFRLSLGMNI